MAKPIGSVLLETGAITQLQLDAALEQQRRFGGRLATTCLNLGYADEQTLAKALSFQLGIPFVVLSQSAIPLVLLKHLPHDVAKNLNVLPFHREEENLFIAMADPHNSLFVDEIRFVTGAAVTEHGALSGPLQEATEEAYRLDQLHPQAFYKGSQLDPSLALGVMGHAEIVIGREIAPPDAESLVASPAAEPGIAAKSDTGWSAKLDLKLSSVRKEDQTSVLVVDDDDALRRMLVEFLSKSGYLTWEAADGRQAMQTLQSDLPDAILLDAMLPGVHGFDICRLVKNAEATRRIPVIMISAVYRGKDHSEKVRLFFGANAYLEKPLKLKALKQVLENCLMARESKPSYQQLSARVREAVQRANAAFQRGDLAGAADGLCKAVAIAPFFPSIHQRLALLYAQLGESFRSIAQLEQAVALQPTHLSLFQLAKQYEQTGFIRKAYETWGQCLLLCENPKGAEAIRRHMDQLLP